MEKGRLSPKVETIVLINLLSDVSGYARISALRRLRQLQTTSPASLMEEAMQGLLLPTNNFWNKNMYTYGRMEAAALLVAAERTGLNPTSDEFYFRV